MITKTPNPHDLSPQLIHGVVIPGLKDAAAPVNADGGEVWTFVPFVDVAVTPGGGGVAEGTGPLSVNEVCVGVGRAIVALKDWNRTLACAASVALTETVVTDVT
jgi:hypothetical protein